jgi:hypothetical protein
LNHHHFPADSIALVEKLGAAAMSSEESLGEFGGPRKFKIKSYPWRSPELTTWLHCIDSLPLKNSLGVTMAHRTISRRRENSDLESTHPPRKGLPTNFYNRDWVSRQDERTVARLSIKETPFDLPKIDSFIS